MNETLVIYVDWCDVLSAAQSLVQTAKQTAAVSQLP